MNSVDVKNMVIVKKEEGFSGSLLCNATPKLVTLTLKVESIPEGGGKMTILLPWGKIYGQAKRAQPKGDKDD